MNPGSESGSRYATAAAGFPWTCVEEPRAPRVRQRERPDPEPWWRELWRARTPGEHRRAALTWPRRGSSRNGLPGGAKLRSGRAGRFPASPASVGWGRYVRRAERCVEATGLATARNRRPGSCVPGSLHGERRGQRAGANGESDREGPAGAAPATVGEANRKEAEARESGHGSPGREGSGGADSTDASGMEQAREASGTERRKPRGRPKPSRGARTLRTEPARAWRPSSRTCDRKEARSEKGPRRRGVRGARTSREADPSLP